MRRSSRLTSTLGSLLGLALALTAAGCATSDQTPAVGGAEHFLLTSTSSVAAPAYLVRASGAFAAKGTLPASGQSASVVKFPRGTFVLTHPLAGLHVAVRSLNKRTCAAVLVQSGTFTLSSGTGAYAGITGYGTDQASITALLPRRPDGSCNTSGKARRAAGSAATVIEASGSVLIPPHKKR